MESTDNSPILLVMASHPQPTSQETSRVLTAICVVMSLVLGATLLPSCSILLLDKGTAYNGQFQPTDKILVLVDAALYSSLETSLETYHADLQAEGITTVIEQWTGGTAFGLRTLISDRYHALDIDGVFLIGNLPAAWYAMYSDFRYEEFPCDLYLMDPDSQWEDTNNDWRFDKHSPLHPKLYVSRITGSSNELVAYFDKLHRYRTGDLRLPAKAYIFKDDDWFDYNRGSNFGLGLIYQDTDIHETSSTTVKENYITTLNKEGYEFIYQWIHSYPQALCVEEGKLFRYISVWNIVETNIKGHFYNLYDCSAARFTETNLGMTYLTKTDYGLAVFGSTKVGGCYYPLVFNQVLSQGGTWGDAYRNWYAFTGLKSDSWYLGMIILGDPTLTVTTMGPAYRVIDMSLPAEPDAEMTRYLEETEYEFLKDRDLTGFETYREAYPEFF